MLGNVTLFRTKKAGHVRTHILFVAAQCGGKLEVSRHGLRSSVAALLSWPSFLDRGTAGRGSYDVTGQLVRLRQRDTDAKADDVRIEARLAWSGGCWKEQNLHARRCNADICVCTICLEVARLGTS